MKEEIKSFIIDSRLLPSIDSKGKIVHKYSYTDIVDLVKEEYGIEYSKSTIRRICKNNNINKQFQQLTAKSADKMQGALEEADQNGTLAEHLSKLESIFSMDLDIVYATTQIHHSFIQSIVDKIESGQTITPQDIASLSSIGDSSSKRVMKLFEFILSNSKDEKDINVYFPDGMGFKKLETPKKEDDESSD
jgi:hypothetical protein